MGNIHPLVQNKDERKQSYRARFKEDPVTRAMMFTKLKKKMNSKKARAEEILWHIDGKGFDRYDMMNLLVHLVSEGYSLVELCQDGDFPSLMEVRSWMPNHPSFERDLLDAEKVRGEILGEEALRIAVDPEDRNPQSNKLRYEALSKAAARLNSRYQDKQIIQTEDKTNQLSEEQIMERLRAMMDASPELAEIIRPTLEMKEGAEAPPLSESPEVITLPPEDE